MDEDSRAFRWIEEQLGRRSRVRSVRRLTGGLTSLVQAVDVATAGRRSEQLVLRRYLGKRGDTWAENAVRAEAKTLALLSGSHIPAPALVATDASGAATGSSAVLMTRLKGRLQLTPTDSDEWVFEMASMLASIHALELPALEAYTRQLGLDRIEKYVSGPWPPRPLAPGLDLNLWARACEVVAEMPAPGTKRVVHGDFQQFNLLWIGERISGVTDWTGTRLDAVELDTGHCRLNLAVLYSADLAERFRMAYEATSGRPIDRLLDLRRIVSDFMPGDWSFVQRQAGRRLRIDVAGIVPRVEELVSAALRAIE